MPSLRSTSIRIRLANTGDGDALPTIRPGEILYGEVEYQPSTPERLSALTVCLLGKLVVKSPKGRREVTQVFGVQHPILRTGDEPLSLTARSHKFPFHFVIPWTTEYDRSGTFKDDPEGLFEEQPHRVPPTLGPKSKGGAQVLYSCYAVGRKTGIRINEFSAMQDFPSGEELENIQCVVRVPELEQSQPITVYRELLPPTKPATSRLFQRRSTSATDVSCFGKRALTVSCPAVVAIEKTAAVNVLLSCSQAATTESVDGLDWTVGIKSVDLVIKTYRRIKDEPAPWVDEESRSLSIVQSPVPMRNGISSTEEFDIGRDVVGSFKSYTISRLHHLRVTIRSGIVNGSGKGRLEEDVCVELPVEVIQQGDSLARRVSAVGAQGVGAGQRAPPPAYEDSPGYRE